MSENSNHHVVSPKIYAAILGALLLGTYLTVQAAKIDLGRWNIVLALLIATIKMTLVILFFMHVKYGTRLTWTVVVGSVFWLGILLVLTLSDYLTRRFLKFGGA